MDHFSNAGLNSFLNLFVRSARSASVNSHTGMAVAGGILAFDRVSTGTVERAARYARSHAAAATRAARAAATSKQTACARFMVQPHQARRRIDAAKDRQ